MYTSVKMRLFYIENAKRSISEPPWAEGEGPEEDPGAWDNVIVDYEGVSSGDFDAVAVADDDGWWADAAAANASAASGTEAVATVSVAGAGSGTRYRQPLLHAHITRTLKKSLSSPRLTHTSNFLPPRSSKIFVEVTRLHRLISPRICEECIVTMKIMKKSVRIVHPTPRCRPCPPPRAAFSAWCDASSPTPSPRLTFRSPSTPCWARQRGTRSCWRAGWQGGPRSVPTFQHSTRTRTRTRTRTHVTRVRRMIRLN